MVFLGLIPGMGGALRPYERPTHFTRLFSLHTHYGRGKGGASPLP